MGRIRISIFVFLLLMLLKKSRKGKLPERNDPETLASLTTQERKKARNRDRKTERQKDRQREGKIAMAINPFSLAPFVLFFCLSSSLLYKLFVDSFASSLKICFRF